MNDRAVAMRSDPLDVLRGSAALLVFFYHCVHLWPGAAHGVFAIVHQGFVGVDLFLVISGYVTTSSLLGLHASGRPDADREYWKRRLARIFPLYWLTTALYVLCVPGGDLPLRGPDGWFQAITHVVLLHGWFPSTATSINPVTWTLTLEACLYGFGWLVKRFGSVERHPVRWSLAVFAMVFAWRAFVFTTMDPTSRIHFVTQVFGACDGFWLGLLCAVGVHRGVFAPARLSPFARTSLLVVGVLLAHHLAVVMEVMGDGYWTSPWCVILVRTGFAFAFTLLLIVAVGARRVSVLLRPLQHAGTLSYGIYLWHPPVLLMLLRVGMEPWQRTLAALAITIALSAASYRWFELPIVRWARR